MVREDAASQREQRRRTDAAIARMTACHMSDAKWRKLFAVLAGLELGPVRWKFVRDDRVFEQPVPPARAILERSLGDVLPDPYVPYREIEWIEIPPERTAGAAEALAAVGQFPIQVSATGLRVIGYSR
jgi:hypothetical protein